MIKCPLAAIVVAVPNLLSLMTAVYLSVLGDAYGRRSVLLLNIGMMCLTSIGQTALVFLDAPLWCFIPVGLVTGLGGNTGCFIATLFASVADVTNSNERNLNLTVKPEAEASPLS